MTRCTFEDAQREIGLRGLRLMQLQLRADRRFARAERRRVPLRVACGAVGAWAVAFSAWALLAIETP